MQERARFRYVATIRLGEEEIVSQEVKEKILKERSSGREADLNEIFSSKSNLYDMFLETATSFKELSDLITDLREKLVAPSTINIFDISMLSGAEVKVVEVLITDLPSQSVSREISRVVDLSLIKYQTKDIPIDLSTYLQESPQRSQIDSVRIIDISLGAKVSVYEEAFLRELITDLSVDEVASSVETTYIGGETQLPILEKEFIGSNRKLPRSFSESLNKPIILLVGENKHKWHIPILYVLVEIFREISDKHPRITFRLPETFEEGFEEHVDSLKPHSLEHFTLEGRIEFLDARDEPSAVEELYEIVRGRLNSAFLQQFGVLVIAVRENDLKEAIKSLKVRGVDIYVCKPNDQLYYQFISKILGVISSETSEDTSEDDVFFRMLKTYTDHLNKTVSRFSVFVERDLDSSDKYQYAYKVATFVYLLNELRKKKMRTITSPEELYKFVREVLDKEIKIEKEIPIGDRKIIPDIIYSPLGEEPIYIEIETLIGTLEPMKKIDETIEKYRDFPKATVWIVLRPVSAVIHYDELRSRKKVYEILYEGKRIIFKVLALKVSRKGFKWDLVDLDRFMEVNKR